MNIAVGGLYALRGKKEKKKMMKLGELGHICLELKGLYQSPR